MSKNQQYAERYAAEAMEQMKRYGIPASVTLAQGILESRNGQSELSQLGNNHFGVKASKSWLKNGGDYLVYTDDKPNEKFCKYATVGDSYEHHSKILKNSSRYSQCFKLSPDDYKGWTKGIERGGYATNGGYAASLQKIIEINGLQKYDQQVMQEMRADGKKFGVEQNARTSATVSSSVSTSNNDEKKQTASQTSNDKYSFPVKRDEFLFVTSPFGMRQDPMDKSKQQMHKGIDIRAKHDDVLATENGGKVVAVNHNANTGGGKSVTVEYARSDGSKVQTTYMHLDSIAVKVFDDLYDTIEGKPNTKGECFHLNMLSTTCHIYFGKMMNATPNGRLAGRAISDGTSPSHGADTHGPSAVVKSLGKLDQVKSGGTLLNQRFLPSLLKRDEDIAKLASLIRSYFALGGHHIQFNIVDTATLHAAQKHPEEYRDLLVRVAGYSDYFNDMNADLQYDVIARTAQETF